MRFQRSAPVSRTLATLLACAWMVLCCAIHYSSTALAHDDSYQIRALIAATWDKPDSKVETDPIVVSGDYAVASWTQGTRGGRALLRRDGQGWSVVLCSGDPLKDAGWLVEAGVSQADAERLARELGKAENGVLPERRAKFSLFEGVVPGGSDHVPPDPLHPHP